MGGSTVHFARGSTQYEAGRCRYSLCSGRWYQAGAFALLVCEISPAARQACSRDDLEFPPPPILFVQLRLQH